VITNIYHLDPYAYDGSEAVCSKLQHEGSALRNRLPWTVGFLVFFFAATIIFFGIQTSFERARFRKDFKDLLYHDRVITLSLKLLSDAKDLETGQRGFLLTDNPSYLEPYQNSQKSILAHLDILLSISRKSPAILAQIETSGQLVASEISILNRAILTQKVFGQKKALQIVLGGEPKRRMDNLRLAIGDTLLTQNREIVLIESRTFKDRKDVRRNFFFLLGSSTLFMILTVMIIFEDIRKRNKLMKRLEEESTHDELTGLPNRRFLFEWLPMTISQDRKKEYPFTLLFLDLNHFKDVNDHLGHTVGDLVLKKAVIRFHSALREGDLLVRLGGDEFIAVIREKLSQTDQEMLVRRLKNNLEHPSLVPKDFPVPFGLSVGIAHFPENGTTLEALLQFADKKMYEDKMARNHGSKTKS